MKKYFGIMAAALISLSLLGACGSNPDNQNDTQVQTQAIATEQASETADGTAAAEQASETAGGAPAESAAAANTVQNNTPNSGTANNDTAISEEDAKNIVLEHAGLTDKDVNFVKVKTDYDNGRMEYELEFYYGNEEYDYELDAASGEILSFDHEIESKKAATTASGEVIGEEKAKEIALERAGLSENEVSGIHVEYDVDDGIAEYEVDFYVGRTEYDVKINAETGDIIGYEEDRD